MRAQTLSGLLALVLALTPTGHAHAWGSLLLIEAPPTQDTLAAGATWWAVPRSPEGRQTTYALSPALDYYRHDGWFASTEAGLGLNLSHSSQWQAGARLWPQFGRARQDATPAAPRLGPRLQQQLFANAMLGEVALLQTAVSHGAGRDLRGVQAEVGLTSGVPIPGGLLGVGVARTWGNGAFRRDYNGLSGAGWSDWSWTLSVEHRLNAQWHFDAQFQQARVQTGWPASGDAAGATSPGHARPHAALLTLWRDL
jgi:hypothetical protein